MKQSKERFGSNFPTLSVVTLSKNDSVGLWQTVESLNQQDFLEWEQIIVVGESSDQTEEVAESAASDDSRKLVIFQEDSGIYQAMNIALDCAKGSYIWFMNSGDVFHSPNTIKLALERISNLDTDVLIGGYSYPQGEKTISIAKSSKRLTSLEISLNRRGLCHQSIIYKTQSLRKIRGYDTVYKLAADFKSILEISQTGKVWRSNEILSRIQLGGVSQTQLRGVLSEKQEIRQEIFGKFSLNFMFGFLWTSAVRVKKSIREVNQIN